MKVLNTFIEISFSVMEIAEPYITQKLLQTDIHT